MNFERPEQDQKLSFREIIEGTEIVCEWDDGYHDYVLYLPKIELGDEARKRDVPDQLFRIGDDPEIAKRVFEFAKSLAEAGEDVYDIYKKSREFAESILL